MLSIVTVSKGRHEIFLRSVKSIWENAADPNNIEHIVATDFHDQKTNDFMDRYIEMYPDYKIAHHKVRLPPCEECSESRGKPVIHYEKRNIHKDYWNPIATQANGSVIFGMTNDVILETTGFDTIMLEAVEEAKKEHSHSYFQVLIDDDEKNILPESAKPFYYCSLIILTKEAVRVLGGIAPDQIVFSGADQYMGQIFSNTLFKSQIDLRDRIVSQSISHHTGKQDAPDDVTISHPLDDTNWIEVANKQYDLALDYAIIKQVKWVRNEMVEQTQFIDSSTKSAIEDIRAKLIHKASDGRGGWKENYHLKRLEGGQ